MSDNSCFLPSSNIEENMKLYNFDKPKIIKFERKYSYTYFISFMFLIFLILMAILIYCDN